MEPLNTVREVASAFRLPYTTVGRVDKVFQQTGSVRSKKRGRQGIVVTESMKR